MLTTLGIEGSKFSAPYFFCAIFPNFTLEYLLHNKIMLFVVSILKHFFGNCKHNTWTQYTIIYYKIITRPRQRLNVPICIGLNIVNLKLFWLNIWFLNELGNLEIKKYTTWFLFTILRWSFDATRVISY